MTVPASLPVDEYRRQRVEALTRAVERERENLRNEEERVRSQNAWVTALRDSLAREEVTS